MIKETSNISLSILDDVDEEPLIVRLFLDDEEQAFAELYPPVKAILDSTKIPDGKHVLKVVATSSGGEQGVKEIRFEVRNGPAISVVGIKENDVVEDRIPIVVNAYRSDANHLFVVRGSETPQAIPSWVWVGVILFMGWALFYLIHNA